MKRISYPPRKHHGGLDNPKSASAADLSRTARLVAAYVMNNHVRPEDLAPLICQVHSCVSRLDGLPGRGIARAFHSSADVLGSIGQDYIVSFLDGKPYKSLKRHLSANGLSPDHYRVRYGLPKDYPMVSPNYSAKRSQIARQIGLGSQVA